MNPVPPVHVLLYRACIWRMLAQTQPVTVTERRRLGWPSLAGNQNKQRPVERIHTNETGTESPARSLLGRWKWCVNVHAEQIWSFALIVPLIFADMLSAALEPASLPHLFSFHQQDFKAHFVSSATVPPSLARYCSYNRVPQLEVKSLAIPPPWLRPPIASVATTELSATPSASGHPSLLQLTRLHSSGDFFYDHGFN